MIYCFLNMTETIITWKLLDFNSCFSYLWVLSSSLSKINNAQKGLWKSS